MSGKADLLLENSRLKEANAELLGALECLLVIVVANGLIYKDKAGSIEQDEVNIAKALIAKAKEAGLC